jgi:two-component system sensor histidine kinase CpxA
MNRLFLKIFGWLLLILILVSSALVIVTIAALPMPPERMWNPALESGRFFRQGIIRNLRSAVNYYESAGEESYLLRKEQLPLLRGTLIFDSSGREITGAPVPSDRIEELIGSLRNSDRTDLNIPPFIGLRVLSDSGSSYYCVFRSDQIGRGGMRLGFINRFQVSAYDNLSREMILSLLVVFLIAGILCFFLARYLTTPISRLRSTTRELTEGKLSARIGSSMGRRNDEIGYLARDFDLMAEQIEKLLKSQTRLIRDISHELRSPLARLNVALELARLTPEEGKKPALDRIEQESRCLNNLIEQLLTLSRMESGAMDSKQNSFDLGEMIRSIAEDAEFESGSKNINVDVSLKDEITFTGYEQALRSALENVVRNALDYTFKNTTVTISVASLQQDQNCFVRIVIRDQGEGVPESELEKIFTSFYRLAPSRDRNSGGSGIGLAITERAVKLHGGSVKASNHPEGGLVVTITLPLD